MRSTGLADTKPSFGVKLARSCLRSMHWAEEDLRTEVAISTSAAGINDPLTSTRNAELANHQAKIQRFWQASDENIHRQIGFVLSKRPVGHVEVSLGPIGTRETCIAVGRPISDARTGTKLSIILSQWRCAVRYLIEHPRMMVNGNVEARIGGSIQTTVGKHALLTTGMDYQLISSRRSAWKSAKTSA